MAAPNLNKLLTNQPVPSQADVDRVIDSANLSSYDPIVALIRQLQRQINDHETRLDVLEP